MSNKPLDEAWKQKEDAMTKSTEELLAKDIYESNRASFKHNHIADLDPWEEIEEGVKDDFRYRAEFLLKGYVQTLLDKAKAEAYKQGYQDAEQKNPFRNIGEL